MIHIRETSGRWWAFLWDEAATTKHVTPDGTTYVSVDEGSMFWRDFDTQEQAQRFARANEDWWITRSRAWKAYRQGRSVANRSWMPLYRMWSDEEAVARGEMTLDDLADNVARGAYA